MKTMITKLTLQGFKSFNRRVSIPFTNGFNVICGPNGSGKCLSGESLVQLSSGERRQIKDIVDNALEKAKEIEEIEDGFIARDNPENIEVLSLDSETFLIRPKKVFAFVKRKSPDNLMRIKTRSGREIKATNYHPVFTFKNGELLSLKADELEIGSKIATPRLLDINCEIEKLDFVDTFSKEDNLYVPYSKELDNFVRLLIKETGGIKNLSEKCGVPYSIIKSVLDKQSINICYLIKISKETGKEFYIDKLKSKTHSKSFNIPKKLTEELARFLGYIISDGTSLKDTSQLRFVNEDQVLINDFSQTTYSQFGLLPSNESYKPVAQDSIIYSRPLQTFLDKTFGIKLGSKSEVIETPSQIFTAPKNIRCHFLAGLIDGDGYIHAKVRRNKHSCYLEYSTASRNLAEQVSTLLLSLGVISIVKEKSKHATNTPQKRNKKYYSVIVYGSKNVQRLIESIPLRSKKITNLNEILKWKIKSGDNIDTIPGCSKLVKDLVRELDINIKKVRSQLSRLAAYYEGRCNATRQGLLEVIEFVTDNYPVTNKAEQIIKKLLLLANSDIFWDEVISIEKIESDEEWVYDLSIETTHNFIANNFVVHNSNILDAVCFVLGRTSAKSLRADRLHELIFHGADGRKPADIAAVSLYLDNSNKVFQEFEEPEISVTRKVNRRGVTDYKLNGRTTTREKILQVLSSARIHPEGYNIVLQGDVTQIIEMNPIERRQIIDEISGIAEYNDKKEKAQRDLEAVDGKLKEAEIIITQRYDIYKKLEEERNAAIKYQNLQKQLTVLKASFLNKKLQTFTEQLEKTNERILEKEEQNKKLTEELETIEEELENKESAIRDVADKLIDLSKRVEIEKEISEIRSQLLIKKDRIETNLREIERLNNLLERLEALESKKTELTGEMPRAVQAILRLNLRGVHGTVVNLISVPEKYQIPVEVAAGPHLHDIVVEDDDVASYCIEYLRRERIGRATFLPLNKIKPIFFKETELIGKHGVVGVASKVIKYDSKLMSAVEFVFGNTLIVENLDIGRAMGVGRVRMVTLEGDLIERSGAMIGGYYIKSHPKFVESATKQDIERYTSLRKQLEEEVAIVKEDVVELEKKLKKYAIAEETKQFIDLEKLRITSERDVDELRDRRRKSHERKVNLEIELNRLNIEKAKVETELENLKPQLQSFGEIQFLDEKLHVLEEFIRKSEKELASIGLVNLKSIDDFEKFKTEFDEYKVKYEKILEEKKAVIGMIEKIEEKRKEVFYKCLTEISNEFNAVFVKMMSGAASLELENPQDLESGLIIKASPRGKTLLNIDAMSGGEKSLTALAFLFAIQKHRPAPFYILDEVDAALDKENSKIIAELIKKLSKDNQFIVITHNDTTIKYGDRIYGCSMIEGETKIMGLELPKA